MEEWNELEKYVDDCIEKAGRFIDYYPTTLFDIQAMNSGNFLLMVNLNKKLNIIAEKLGIIERSDQNGTNAGTERKSSEESETHSDV